ncbi:MAG: enoyl-CoA hydratase/isomerase family protein, partial [Deltaproteobacteria bacterium]|nr:enoyl-CoA hydratase/isomerase family protein [Deltaproteobacteria bacterium]
MSYQTIKLEISDAIATLTFNRPDVLNAINPEMIREFHQALREVQEMAEIKVLILTGAGKAFVACADIQVLQGLDALGAKQFAQVGQ